MTQKVNALNVGWTKRKQGLPVRKEVVGIGLITVVVVLVVATVLALISTASPGVSRGTVAGLEASSARWAALGATYTRDYDAIAAVSSARWSAMGEAYLEGIQAGLEASSARWAALGAHYMARYEAAAAASSARYQAQAEWYARQAALGR